MIYTNRNYKLYVHIAPNGKRYYGITMQKPEKRWNNGRGYSKNQHFFRAINKYGWDNIEHIILHKGLSKDEATELEQYMIQWYDTANREYGYNISNGGEGGNNGCERTEEWVRKMSEANKGRCCTEETRQKLRENHADFRGENNPRARTIICITTKRIFQTVNAGAEYYNIYDTNITKCCKGKAKSAGKSPTGEKLVWKYIDIIEL